jgi:hypothetical protein
MIIILRILRVLSYQIILDGENLDGLKLGKPHYKTTIN